MADPRHAAGSPPDKGAQVPEKGSGDPLRVLVADDDPLARRLIRDALQGAGFVVVADAKTGREAVELTLHYRPDFVLMDVVMPELDGIAAVRQIRQRAPDVRVVILSTSADEDMGVLGIRAGAAGYLTKDVDVVHIPGLLQRVAAGEPALSPQVTTQLIEELRRLPIAGRGMRPVRSDLSSREWEVLDLLAEGKSEEEIADELVLSHETVRSHVKSLHRKLGVHTRAELIAAVDRLREPPHAEG